MIDIELLQPRLAKALEELAPLVPAAGIRVEDEDLAVGVRQWLDGNEPPLDWAGPGITPDEFLFITTLYGTMTREGQRTHIRTFFPLFVQQAGRDIRNFTIPKIANWELRSPWMKTRLCRMAEVLRQSGLTMEGYVSNLCEIESKATPNNPMPALDRIIRDHRANAVKTLSVFIRDCVKGNCFPIDRRVENQLKKYGLPVNERCLVSLCLSMDLNPRKVARIFYGADEEHVPGKPSYCG